MKTLGQRYAELLRGCEKSRRPDVADAATAAVLEVVCTRDELRTLARMTGVAPAEKNRRAEADFVEQAFGIPPRR